MKEYKCERCCNTVWNDEPICLELHHKNCTHTDNELSNLQILCPNCHSQQHKKKTKVVIKREPKLTFCPDCGKKISYGAIHCSDCYSKYRRETGLKCCKTKITWPSKNELLTRFSKSSYLALGKELGVSDNAIRKHLKNS